MIKKHCRVLLAYIITCAFASLQPDASTEDISHSEENDSMNMSLPKEIILSNILTQLDLQTLGNLRSTSQFYLGLCNQHMISTLGVAKLNFEGQFELQFPALYDQYTDAGNDYWKMQVLKRMILTKLPLHPNGRHLIDHEQCVDCLFPRHGKQVDSITFSSSPQFMHLFNQLEPSVQLRCGPILKLKDLELLEGLPLVNSRSDWNVTCRSGDLDAVFATSILVADSEIIPNLARPDFIADRPLLSDELFGALATPQSLSVEEFKVRLGSLPKIEKMNRYIPAMIRYFPEHAKALLEMRMPDNERLKRHLILVCMMYQPDLYTVIRGEDVVSKHLEFLATWSPEAQGEEPEGIYDVVLLETALVFNFTEPVITSIIEKTNSYMLLLACASGKMTPVLETWLVSRYDNKPFVGTYFDDLCTRHLKIPNITPTIFKSIILGDLQSAGKAEMKPSGRSSKKSSKGDNLTSTLKRTLVTFLSKICKKSSRNFYLIQAALDGMIALDPANIEMVKSLAAFASSFFTTYMENPILETKKLLQWVMSRGFYLEIRMRPWKQSLDIPVEDLLRYIPNHVPAALLEMGDHPDSCIHAIASLIHSPNGLDLFRARVPLSDYFLVVCLLQPHKVDMTEFVEVLSTIPNLDAWIKCLSHWNGVLRHDNIQPRLYLLLGEHIEKPLVKEARDLLIKHCRKTYRSDMTLYTS